MAAIQQFSNPQVLVNNVSVAVMPNSFKFTLGKGDDKVRALSAGGNSTVSVYSTDMSTRISKMQFDLAVTPDTLANYSTWKNNNGLNVVQASQVGFPPIVFTSAVIVNDPQFEATADGKVTLEWMTDPVSGF
jgi:hypothetical protein